jgi:hypothetical protein
MPPAGAGVVMARRMARRVMVQEIRSESWPAAAAARARAAWVSWQAHRSAQISWAIPAGVWERSTWPGPRVKTLISRLHVSVSQRWA